jgi:hypothetical protein
MTTWMTTKIDDLVVVLMYLAWSVHPPECHSKIQYCSSVSFSLNLFALSSPRPLVALPSSWRRQVLLMLFLAVAVVQYVVASSLLPAEPPPAAVAAVVLVS